MFATVGQLGTEPDLAVRAVPEPAEGAAGSRLDGRVVLGTASTRSSRGRSAGSPTTSPRVALRRSTSRRTPNKKIAIVYQNDDYGKDYLYGFRRRSGRRTRTQNIVAREAVEATATSVAAQMTRDQGDAERRSSRSSRRRRRRSARSRPAKALGYNPEQIYMNSVAQSSRRLDAAVAVGRRAVHERDHHDRVLQGSAGPEVGQRPGDEAVPVDHRQVRRRRERRTTAGTCTASRRPRRSCRSLYKAGKNLDPRGPDERAAEHELPNKFLLPGSRAEDVEDGSLHHQPDAAPAVQLDHGALRAVRQADRGSPALGASLSRR